MPTVFFSYFLHATVLAEEFEERILRDVAPRARAEESVERWTLHPANGWPGSSEDAPDYICVVEVSDLQLWSSGASASISETHGSSGRSRAASR
jgi:hypothetical protein